MPPRGIKSVKPDSRLARRLSLGIRRRCDVLGLTIEALPAIAGVARNTSSLHGWMSGRSRISLQDAIDLDRFFASRGLPGLIEECLEGSEAVQWRYRELPLDSLKGPSRALLEATEKLRGKAGLSIGEIASCLGPLINDVILLACPDAAFRPFHFGSRLPVDVAAHVMTRDIRTILDKEYGEVLHRSLKDALRNGPVCQRIESRRLCYDRLAIPLDGSIVITSSFNWHFPGADAARLQLD